MGILVEAFLRFRNTDVFQPVHRALLLFFDREVGMGFQHFQHLIPDGIEGIKCGHRLLKDHPDLFTPYQAIGFRGQIEKTFIIKENLAF